MELYPTLNLPRISLAMPEKGMYMIVAGKLAVGFFAVRFFAVWIFRRMEFLLYGIFAIWNFHCMEFSPCVFFN